MKNSCPFKVIEEVIYGNKTLRKWIALTINIDYEHNIYKSIMPFHDVWRRDEIKRINNNQEPLYFDKIWINKLIDPKIGNNPSQIVKQNEDNPYPYDIIRNPTLEEMIFIQQVMQLNGYKFNRKTNKLIEIKS